MLFNEWYTPVAIKFEYIFHLGNLHSPEYRVGKDLRPPLHSFNHNHLRKSTHIASKYYQCRTPVPNATPKPVPTNTKPDGGWE